MSELPRYKAIFEEPRYLFSIGPPTRQIKHQCKKTKKKKKNSNMHTYLHATLPVYIVVMQQLGTDYHNQPSNSCKDSQLGPT